MKLGIKRGCEVLGWHLKDRGGYKEETIKGRISYLKIFEEYLREKHIYDLREIRSDQINDFMGYCRTHNAKRSGEPIKPATLKMILASVKLLFRALYQEEQILTNPARDITIKWNQSESAKSCFTITQINRFLDSIDIDEPCGLRDRSLFELVYSSALRVSEVSRLDRIDLDFEERMLMVRQGKFSKDRMVPVSLSAVNFLKSYCGKRRDGPLFISSHRGRLSPSGIEKRFHIYMRKAVIDNPGLSVHSIRHSCATHLMEAGADIRYVQELLGHESVETTVIYTHILDDSMKRSYRTYHPRENELYLEVDDSYKARLFEFKAQLEKQKKIRDRRNRNKAK